MSLRSDLEQLSDAVDRGWGFTAPKGERGCLLTRMNTFTEGNGYRNVEMMQAMGFAICDGMYTWNDQPGRTWEDVKLRVKEALYKLEER